MQPGTQVGDGPGGWHFFAIVPPSAAYAQNTSAASGAKMKPATVFEKMPMRPGGPPGGSRALIIEAEKRSPNSPHHLNCGHGIHGAFVPARAAAP